VLFGGANGDVQRCRDGGVRLTLGHQLQHLALARGQLVECAAPMRAHQDLRHHFRIEHGAATADHLNGVQERRDICHAILQQVAESLCVRGDQVRSVALLDVVRQHQHR
jgi:hypothetical protein